MRLFPAATSTIPITLLLCLQISAVSAQTPIALSNESLIELARYQEQLADLESEFGPYDLRLVETLQSVEALLLESGDLDRVEEMQGRRLQILRTTEGFEHPELVPVLEDMIETNLKRGEWEAVTDQLEHIRLINSATYGPDSDQALEAMDRKASWHLARVYLDTDRRRPDNLLDAREIYRDALDLAEDRFGEESPQLIPWLYRRAFVLSQMVAFMNTDDSLAGETINEAIQRDGIGRLQGIGSASGFGTAHSWTGQNSRVAVSVNDEPVGVAYLRQARGFIDDVRDIAESEGDIETQAMATLYYGDFQILMGRGAARKSIREATELLLEAGISQQRLEAFFERPMVIPLENFYHRFEDLEAYQQETLQGIGDIPEELVHVGKFYAWEDGLRSTSKPRNIPGELDLITAASRVELSFRVNSRGHVSNVNTLEAVPAERRIERRASRAARDLQFRPAYVEGRAVSVRNAQMSYLAPEED